MLALGKLIDVAVVHHGAALARQAHVGHILFKVLQRVVLHNHLFGLQSMFPAADALAHVF